VPIKGEKPEEKEKTHNHDPDAPNALVLYRAPKFDKYDTFIHLALSLSLLSLRRRTNGGGMTCTHVELH
jgi:hypothetical protein